MESGREEKPAIPQEVPSLSSYLMRFRKLCERDSTLKSEVIESKAHLSLEGFRTILWARWLDILSPAVKDWPVDINKSRGKYNNLKALHLDDKRLDPSLHPSVNNPLSQDDLSPWNQFFKDSELRSDIERDVVRSGQDEVKKQEEVKKCMSTILFIYGKEHPDLRYRQGMHELLSAILLLRMDEISCCQRIVQDSAESTTLTLIQTLLKPEMLEQDVYAIFEKVMEYMWDWYFTSSPIFSNGSLKKINKSSEESAAALFAPDRQFYCDLDSQVVSNAAKRLQNMWVNILQLQDKALYDHLVSLNILPTTFGINWTKLLFTRQFVDYFHLWDAIIVSKFTLVDYIVVAMVLAVRAILMKGDSNSCNTILVAKYPPNVCPRYITKLALHLQDSKAFLKPQGSPFITDLSDGATELAIEEKSYEFVQREQCLPQRKDLNKDRLWWHHDRLQEAIHDANDAVESSQCDHGLVQVSLLKLQSVLDALAHEMPRRSSQSNDFVRRHKRATSVAYEALAFE